MNVNLKKLYKSLAIGWLSIGLLSCASHKAKNSFTPDHYLPHGGTQLLSVTIGKQTSGLPTGVIVTWERVADSRAVGYYLYRSTSPIPDVPDPTLRTNGGNLIPQPPSGSFVTFQDMFFPVVGATYYYRVSVVDVASQESELSNEMSITIQGHRVDGINPTQGYYGDLVTLIGENFGIYNPSTDSVLFNTDNLEKLSASIISWNETPGQITAIVPQGAITGKVQVVIAGTIAETDEDFVVLSPFLTEVVPPNATQGDIITLLGENLGDTPSGDDRVVLPGGTVLRYDNTAYILSWGSTQITLRVPPLSTNDGEIYVVTGGVETNGVSFSIRPRLDQLFPLPVVLGSPNEYHIIGINLGNKSDSMLLIVDLSANPMPPVQIPPAEVSVWTNSEIIFRIPSVITGSLPAFRVVRGQAESNDLAFSPFPLLSISFISPQPLSTIDRATDFVLNLSGTEMVERVEYYLLPSSDPFEVQEDQEFYFVNFDPSGFFNGRYTIVAVAYRLAEVASTSITFDLLSLVGDVNADGSVDELDVAELDALFGTTFGQEEYRAYRDPNRDGVIDERDVTLVGYNFGLSIRGE